MNIQSRNEVVQLLLKWLRPLKSHYSAGCAQLCLGHTSAPYGQRDVLLEGYARVLWGIGPLVAQNCDSLSEEHRAEIRFWIKTVRLGLIHGTDPEHEEFWQDLCDYDHKMVEMAAIANTILLAPHHFWDPLSSAEKDNVFGWFDQINRCKTRSNNWILFRILVNVMFDRLGLLKDPGILEQDIATLESNYEDNGWYHDGHAGQKDYYVPFAMHFYGLLFSHFMGKSMPDYCATLRERAKIFYEDFCYWFDEKGRSVPFGRSLTYRFAHTAAFSAMVFAGVDAPIGELKYLVMQNLRYWNEQPIFDNQGILSIGYRYPNLIMSEMYNAPGSPYWAFKTFLVLALPQSHPFWQCNEVVPKWKTQKWLSNANMIAVHDQCGQALLYPAGHFAANAGNSYAKYQKFVYSSEFGFSISRGSTLLDGAFDCTLAVSESADDCWCMRRSFEKFEVTESYTRSLYEILPGVRVESVIIPLKCGHIRLHYIDSDRNVNLADGGFAIAKQMGIQMIDRSMIQSEKGSIHCACSWGFSGAVSLDGTGEAELIPAFPNTNLMHSITLIPTIRYSVCSGHNRLMSFFYGSGGQESRYECPKIDAVDTEIHIWCERTFVRIQGKKWL